LELPAWVRTPDDSVVFAKTRDVSAGGAYLFVNMSLEIGSQIHFTMTLPEELTHRKGALEVVCKGTVVRTQPSPTGQIGVAIAIHSYDWLPKSEQAAAYH
jgi:hypothetical protein